MDTLASLIEVKLDIREKKTEIPLRTWTKCYIKIEAIKCFPCYLKLAFYKNHSQNHPSLELRINIPGLEVYPVKSRTKEFAYGLYWKQNRKQCIAFLSMDSKLSMEAHMKWVECQIQNLEQYRKEVLQTSRSSRIMEQSFTDAEDSGIYQNMNETNRMRDLKDILGPLPQIPLHESDKSWISRRMSGMSEIYEEIVDISRHKEVRNSTIYEEMKLNHRIQPADSPPPLPPRQRKRLDTDCSNLQRSYTSPESDYLVKKRWNIFDVFNKGKKLETKKRDKASPQLKELQLLKAKRNSFSSPDLTHFDVCINSGCENYSFDYSNISSSNSYELENVCEEDDDSNENGVDQEKTLSNGINISQQIKANFEPYSNNDISRVNLVGSNYTLNEISSSKSSPTMSPPGYLEMKPGKGFDMKKVEQLDKQMIQNDILYRLKYSFESPITYKREFDYDTPSTIISRTLPEKSIEKESVYVPMNVGTKYSPKVSTKLSHQVQASHDSNSIYVQMNRVPTLIIQPPHQVNDSSTVQTNENICKVCNEISTGSPQENNAKNKRHSVDDKIASYYPNYDVPSRLKTSPPHERSKTPELITNHKSTLFETESKSNLRQEKSLAVPIPMRKAKRFGSFNLKSYSNSFNDDINNRQSKNDEVTKLKYATIARITSPPKHKSSNEDLVNDSLKKSGSISPGSIKRISTLSKLKKLDFSPLREKISNALKKQNSGSC